MSGAMGKGGRPFDGEKMEMMECGCEAEVIPEIQVLARQAPAAWGQGDPRLNAGCWGAAPRPFIIQHPQYHVSSFHI